MTSAMRESMARALDMALLANALATANGRLPAEGDYTSAFSMTYGGDDGWFARMGRAHGVQASAAAADSVAAVGDEVQAVLEDAAAMFARDLGAAHAITWLLASRVAELTGASIADVLRDHAEAVRDA